MANQSALTNDEKIRFFIIVCTCIASLIAFIAVSRIPFNNDIEVMLPRQPEVLRGFHFFRESPLAKNVAVSFALKDAVGTFSDLTVAVDQFTVKIDSPMITHVLSGLESKQSLDEIQEFVRLAPQLAGEEQLLDIDAKLNAPEVSGKLEKFYRTLISPAGAFMAPVLKQDPLGFHEKALRDLQSLHASMDFDVRLQDGYLISRDGRHALVVMETNVPITDGDGAKKLISYLEGLLKPLPPRVSADLVAGHLHSISNEKVIKRDILVTSLVSSAAFLIIFIGVFKDFRAILLFTIPLLSVLISVPVSAWITGQLSFVIMGMAAVIAGIADDYCIHVYMAMQSGQSRKEAIKEVAATVTTGALTTVGVFSVFLFSKVPGYRELSLLTVMSLLLSLGFALLILPYFLGPKKSKAIEKPRALESNFLDKLVMIIWGMLVIACIALIPRLHFQTDVKQYDGSEAEVLRAEDDFEKNWGGKDKPAMLVITAPDFNQALEMNDRLEPEISQALSSSPLINLSVIWPDEKTRAANLGRWNQFWKDGREEKLRGLFQEPSAEYGFAAEAFDPFFKTLRLDDAGVKDFEKLGLLSKLKHRFAFESKGSWKLISFFEDKEDLVEAVNQKIAAVPEAFVVSSKRFTSLLSDSILSESVYMASAIMLMILTVTFLFLRNIKLTLIALIPVVTSILFIFGAGTVLKIQLNAASMIALLVVGGLCIDSGIFMVNHYHHRIKTNTRRSVTLSALTTIIGAGALVFAKHPVLFSYGTTMAFGITAGYFSAMFVVPAVYRLAMRNDAERAAAV